jgi:hypothetical protein
MFARSLSLYIMVPFFSLSQRLFLPAVLCLLLFVSCDRTPSVIPIEGITTIRLIFTQPGGNTLTYQFKDIDGIGGQNPVVDEIVLPPLSVFNCSIELLNESVTPVKDWTAVVKERADIHLFDFKATNDVIRFNNLNTDANGKPFGLTSQAASKGGTGTLTVILKHEVNKETDEPARTGVTDIEATFPVKI